MTEPLFRLEVILREEGFELTNGSSVIAAVPKVGGKYDLKALSEMALSLKRDHPDVDEDLGAARPQVAYDDLIQVMDAIRSAEDGSRHFEALAAAGHGWHARQRSLSLAIPDRRG